MATFSYDAKDGAGRTVSGLIEGADPKDAANLLREQGFFPLRIEAMTLKSMGGGAGAASLDAALGPVPPAMAGTPAAAPIPPTAPPSPSPSLNDVPFSPYAPPVGTQTKIDAAPFLVSVPLPDLAMFYRQMATLMNAGVPMVQALTTLAVQSNSGRLKSVLNEAAQSVAAGNPFSKTMERHPSVFAPMQIEMIHAAEHSGMMERMCTRLAEYLEREIEIRRKLKRETLYPKIVLFVAWCVGGIILWAKSLNGGGGPQGYITASFYILVTVGAIWWLTRFLNQYPRIGAAWDEVKMLIPGVGGVSRRYATARFARALSVLYSGGILLPNAVVIAARACGNRAIGQALIEKIPLLHAGQGIAGMLAASGLLSPIAVQMARTGEQTGNLDAMMDKVADYLESEADAKAHQLAVYAGVGALLIAAIVVANIVFSFYTGMFSGMINAAGAE
jgi:type II secretory pathway component PulF